MQEVSHTGLSLIKMYGRPQNTLTSVFKVALCATGQEVSSVVRMLC